MYIQSSWKVPELLHVVLHDTSAAPASQKHAWKFLIPPHSTGTVVTADTYTSRKSPQNLYGPSSGLVGGCSWKSPVGWQPQGGSQAHSSFCSGEETVLQLPPCFNSLSNGPWRQRPQGCTKGRDLLFSDSTGRPWHLLRTGRKAIQKVHREQPPGFCPH